jgi:ribose/xylose/arabinose/galactoside ABC-type transport system permease subunit
MNLRPAFIELKSWSVPILLLGLAMWLTLSQLPSFSSVPDLWREWSEVGILACGMTAVMLAGGIDLSVGSIAALACVCLGLCWRDLHLPLPIACLACVAVGTLAGALNGVLVTLGLPSLVATLATMAFYSGAAMALAQGNRIALPGDFAAWGDSSAFGVPIQLLAFGAVFFVLAVAVHGTRWGRCVYAIGDNRRAAAFAAVPVARVELSLYCVMGLLAGVVAVLHAVRGGSASPDPKPDLALRVIACVILGGTAVTGGQGSVFRTLLGVAILAHLEIGMSMLSSRDFHWPWGGKPWRLTAEARLVVVGLAVIVVAAWNERVAGKREG